MTISHVLFWLWIVALVVTLAVNTTSLVRLFSRLRRIERDREKIVTAHVESFEVTDGWVLAHVCLSTDKFETWAIGQGGEQWRRLPEMVEASPSMSAWLTHELGADNERRRLERLRVRL